MEKNLSTFYRKDIDGLRAIAVLSVILYHFGYLPNGYLGVDIFFVISGYLITKIIFKEVIENKFSITQFYLRRIRRIIPLVLFTTSIALIIASFVMLPDDLDNLSQSVIATNFFANNILLLITTGNYWNIVNEYKPLMHTWSLGIEEQFYLIYPLIFLTFQKKRIRWILPILLLLTIISMTMFISSSDEAYKFYSIQFRFFELSLGGIGSIVFRDKIIKTNYKLLLLPIIFLILISNIDLPSSLKLFLIIISSLGVLLSVNNKNKLDSFILENKMMVYIGKISFSLYMWHQIVLAFARYFIFEKYNVIDSVFIFIFILFLSIVSYIFIEQPFRDKNRIKTSILLWYSSILFIISTFSSLYIYSKAGIIKDFSELDLTKDKHQRDMNIKYNNRINDLDKDFTTNNKIKILAIGNSFARDWSNILLESKYGNFIEISYIPNINNSKNLIKKLNQAKYIFFSETDKDYFDKIVPQFKIDSSKVWNIGTKNFGLQNGIFYNKKHDSDYCNQRTNIEKSFFEKNDLLKKQWGNKYIDLIGMIVDKNNTLPVFTPDCKFISEDCKHLTRNGAIYFAKLIENNNNFKIENN
ncbi:MAG: acyltransferase [Cyanobacteriota bacterium]